MTEDEIKNYEHAYINMLAIGEDTYHKDLTTSLSLTGQNFHTLSEKPTTHMDEVAVTVLYGTMLDGTYKAPDSEPVKRYHEYILDVYGDDLPDTTEGIENRLVELTGEMAPLAHVILDTHNLWAVAGVVPFEQFGEDSDYWWAVVNLHECEYNAKHGSSGDDCSAERDYLENRKWLEPGTDEFIPPPGQDWPPSYLDFIIQLAHAWSYASMDYELLYITSGCGGRCDSGIPVSGTTSQYLSGTWKPPMGHNDGCGHLSGAGVHTQFSVARNVNDAYVTSIIQTEAHNKHADDLDHGFKTRALSDTQIRVSNNDQSSWCYSVDYTGYSLN